MNDASRATTEPAAGRKTRGLPNGPSRDVAARATRDAAVEARRHAQAAISYSTAQVRARPVTAAAVALAAGLLLGIAISPLRRLR